MTPDEFWGLIDKHVTFDEDGLPEVDALEQGLASLPVAEIVAYDEIFARFYSESYGWNLWGAAYLINGGCSDDGFDYFRGWLIAKGRKVFESALADPDSLAAVVDDEVECEDMLYVAGKAHEKATDGKELDGASYEYPELGEGWDFDDTDEMTKRYPKLAAKFLNDGDDDDDDDDDGDD